VQWPLPAHQVSWSIGSDPNFHWLNLLIPAIGVLFCWHARHFYAELPKILKPAAGFLHDCTLFSSKTRRTEPGISFAGYRIGF